MAVTIADSVGYEGTVDEEDWATLIAASGGRRYGVLGPSDWQVTRGAADREVRIAPGAGFGPGVLDRTTSESSLVLPSPGTGKQWVLITCHRDWGANTSSFDYITGGTGQAVIPARATTPGTEDDQPLALVSVDAAQAQVGEIIDLRVWGSNGGAYAASVVALQYLNDLGTSILVGNETRADRVLDALGSPVWKYTNVIDRFVRIGTFGEGFTHFYGQGWNGFVVSRFGSVVTGGGAIIKDPNGGGVTAPKGAAVANIPVGYRPGARTATSDPRLEILLNGDVALTQPVNPGTAISFSFTYHQPNTGA